MLIEYLMWVNIFNFVGHGVMGMIEIERHASDEATNNRVIYFTENMLALVFLLYIRKLI